MCGIVALMSKKNKPVGQQVFELYKKQKHRGKDGYGYFAISSDWKLLGIKRALDEDGIKKHLMKDKAPNIMFHHRHPTSTANTIGTTHPMMVKHDELEFDYGFMHNGIIRNGDIIKKDHEELGYMYSTEFAEEKYAVHTDGTKEFLSGGTYKYNDSEVLAIELARHLDDKQTLIKSFGPVAFCGIKLKKGTDQIVSIFYGHNHGRELTTVATKKFKGFTSIHGTNVPEMKIYSYDLNDPVLYEQGFPIDESYPVAKTTPPAVRTPGFVDAANKNLMGDRFRALENKQYTYAEAFDTGVPMSTFSTEHVDGLWFYVPKKFQHVSKYTKPHSNRAIGFTPPSRATERSDAENKNLELLEELCTRIVTLQTQQDKVQVAYTEGYLTESECDEQEAAIDARVAAIEDTISTLGLSQDDIDEVMDLCVQMEDYNTTYNNTLNLLGK